MCKDNYQVLNTGPPRWLWDINIQLKFYYLCCLLPLKLHIEIILLPTANIMSSTSWAHRTFKFNTNSNTFHDCTNLFFQSTKILLDNFNLFLSRFLSDTLTQVTRFRAWFPSFLWVTWNQSCSLIGHRWPPAHHFASIKDLALVLSFLSPWGLAGLGISAQWVRAWRCRDERIRSEAGPVIVRPGAENLHESPLAPNMMDRWSHIDNLCSLVS